MEHATCMTYIDRYGDMNKGSKLRYSPTIYI